MAGPLTLGSGPPAKESIHVTELETQLLDTLANRPQGATAAELARALRVRPARAREALRSLVEVGTLRPPQPIACLGGYRRVYRNTRTGLESVP